MSPSFYADFDCSVPVFWSHMQEFHVYMPCDRLSHIPLFPNADSALFVAQLIRFIFRTLPVYDDQASNNAVDDLVQLALRKPTFLGHFAFMLVETMEQNMKFSRPPLVCFKLLRWSICLLKLKQQTEHDFSRIFNAQAILCQTLMTENFRHIHSCRQLFVHLFSELSDVHKMYVEKVRNSMFHVRESPQFFKLILDFAMTSSSLSSEYKQAFLYLYVGAIINSKDQPSQESS
jgi:hypothetical protein